MKCQVFTLLWQGCHGAESGWTKMLKELPDVATGLAVDYNRHAAEYAVVLREWRLATSGLNGGITDA